MGGLVQSMPVCKVCDKGALVRQKIYRMSAPVVVIGYILLIPSVIGILISALMLAGIIANSSGDTGVIAAQTLAGGIVFVFGIASFVGGLLGWLLVMKKKVLRCSVCSSTVNAS